MTPNNQSGPVCSSAVAVCSAGLILRLRAIADENPATDECTYDEWLAEICRQSADEIERLTQNLAAAKWNADDLCEQRNRMRAFVIAMHGHAVLAELLSPNVKVRDRSGSGTPPQDQPPKLQ